MAWTWEAWPGTGLVWLMCSGTASHVEPHFRCLELDTGLSYVWFPELTTSCNSNSSTYYWPLGGNTYICGIHSHRHM